MREKLEVRSRYPGSHWVVGLRYDRLKEELLIGGRRSAVGEMREIVEACFPGESLPVPVGKYRVRFHLFIDRESWAAGKEVLGKRYLVMDVHGFRRLMN